jgi:hypothetical protein
MTTEEFRKAVKIASDLNRSFLDTDISILTGCGLVGFKPVYTTLQVVAAHLRWQAMQFNGEWDAEALNYELQVLRRKVTII